MSLSQSSPLGPALSRLNKAVDLLEKNVAVRLENEAGQFDSDAEVQRMGADRARLAEALDGATEKYQQLDHVNREVSRRLVDVMEAVRGVIDHQKQL